jgi:hypothetical protein
MRIDIGHIAERVIELVGLGHFGHALNVDVRDDLGILLGDPVRPALLGKPWRRKAAQASRKVAWS